ncbi:hypothetical protein LWI28_003618 [Acer negundo]|uniref:Protein kinase domain-containing protein n=1 Tax=Acer negundo TaxID=4023 RepID=A0AAD5NWD2_ACENE|nr:hypothetical protein LWI28_003618 [Acer negundo]
MCHKNILKLIGCCLDTQIPIFIFESAVYGTLDEHNHNPRELHFEPLLWTHRLRIAMEVANSLAYLHVRFSRPILFSGIKPSGILLDENYVAKLFDFSQSKSIPEGESRVNVKYLKGALGYIAPEYMEALVHNEKCDVYNFGGLLLLLLTGKRVHDLARGTKDESVLSGYVKKHSENNRLFEIVGPIIVGDDQGLCPEKEQQLQDFKELALR